MFVVPAIDVSWDCPLLKYSAEELLNKNPELDYLLVESQISQREDAMERSAIEREPDFGNQKIMSSAIEAEKKELKTATLSAMATLCVSASLLEYRILVYQLANMY